MQNEDDRLKKLVKRYEKFIEEWGNPFYMDAIDLLDIMDYYLHAGRIYDAETCLRHALRLHPTNDEVIIAKAHSLMDEGKFSECLSLIYSLEDQESRGVNMFLGEYRLLLADPTIAEIVFKNYWKLCNNEDYDVCIEIAELYVDYGYWSSALRWLSNVPDNFRDRRHREELRAECYSQMGQYDKAIATLESILDKDPYDYVTWGQLAQIQYRKASYNDAQESCDYALAINSSFSEALRIKILSSIALENVDLAKKCAQEYYKYRPTDYVTYMLLGEALLSAGKTEHSWPYLSLAASLCPHDAIQDNIRIYASIAYFYACRKQYRMVLQTLEKTAAYGVSIAEIHLQTAGLCMEQGERESSISLLEQAIESYRLEPEQLERIAALLCEHKCVSSAIGLWKKLMILSEENTRLIPYLALGMRQIRDISSYHLFLMLACQTDPTLTQTLFKDIYPGKSVFEYLDAANDEFK